MFYIIVEENMETVDNPLHEAAKRGNVSFMRECLANKVSFSVINISGLQMHYPAADLQKCLDQGLRIT